jgi:hypothetical protein
VDFAPLAGVVAVVAAAGVVPLLAAAVTGVADPFKQLVSPEPDKKEEYIKGGQYTPAPA